MTTIDLKDLALFSGCSRRELEQIRALCSHTVVPAGKVIVRRGDPGRECMVIGSGTLTVERDGHVVAEVGAGDVIGEIALIEGGYAPRTATVRTTTQCEVLAFSVGEFNRLLAGYPSIAARIEKIAVHRLSEDLHDAEGHSVS